MGTRDRISEMYRSPAYREAMLSAGQPDEDAFMVPGMGAQPVPPAKYNPANDNIESGWPMQDVPPPTGRYIGLTRAAAQSAKAAVDKELEPLRRSIETSTGKWAFHRPGDQNGCADDMVVANDNVPRKSWRTDLAVERLKELLHYDPVVGIFIRKSTTNHNGAAVGDIAGFVDKDGYVRIGIDGFGYPAHRLAWLYMTGTFPDGDVDHKNNIRTDNRFKNLRPASRSQNNMNQKRRSDNRTGFKGVGVHTGSGLFRARIKLPGVKARTIGYYKTAEEAHDGYPTFRVGTSPERTCSQIVLKG